MDALPALSMCDKRRFDVIRLFQAICIALKSKAHVSTMAAERRSRQQIIRNLFR
jgi:hypothetical protein